MLNPELPSIDDAEGETVPGGLPPVTDAHVHVFPGDFFSAIWQWFDKHAWRIRYRLTTSQVIDFLLSHGIRHIVALQYAHRPGLSAKLNRYMAAHCRKHPGRVTGMATVLPGEDNAARILATAFDAGLGGLKLHAHVQCFDMNAPDMDPLYDLCQSRNKPVVMHVGREPKSTAYRCDPYQLCNAHKLERVLIDYPGLKVCVPHMGFDEVSEYRGLLERYDHLWLDTTMVLTDYFPIQAPIDLTRYRQDRIMYGSDFPNIPYAWDRELKKLASSGLTPDGLDWVLNKSAGEFYDIPLSVFADAHDGLDKL